MSNFNFEENGVNNSGSHLLRYTAFFLSAFAIYFAWAFLNDASFHHFTRKIFKFWNCNGYNPLSYCVMGWNVEIYP